MTIQTFTRALLLAIALLCNGASAQAGTVIQPVGGVTYNAASPFTVKWSNVATSTSQIALEMTIVGGNAVVTAPWGMNLPNNGLHVIPAAQVKSWVCDTLPQAMSFLHAGIWWGMPGTSTAPMPVSQMQFRLAVVGMYGTGSGLSSGNGYSQLFKFKCPKDLSGPLTLGNTSLATFVKGSIKLNKQVINEAPPALAPPSTGFQVQLTCTPNGPNTLVLLNAANNLRETITSILPESVCTISEVPPNVPVELVRRGCRWETSYPDGQSATIEAAVTKELRVVNRWTCTPPGSGGGGGGSGSNNDNKKRISVTPVNDPPVLRADEKREKAKEEKSWIPNIGISVGGSGGGGSKKD